MQTFTSFITEGREAELIGILKSHGAGDIEFGIGYLTVELRMKAQVEDLIDNLPEYTDYDVYVYDIDSNGDVEEDSEEEIDFPNLNDNTHTYEVIIYLDNAEIEIDESIEEDGTQLDERKRIIKVSAKGKRRIKIKCKKGFKFTKNKCVKISGIERVTKRRAIRKAVKTKKRKGSGAQRRTQRLRKRAMKKRKAFGLKSGFEPEGQQLDEVRARKRSYKADQAKWMQLYEAQLSKRQDYQSGRIDWDVATHMYFKGVDPRTAAETVHEPYKGV